MTYFVMTQGDVCLQGVLIGQETNGACPATSATFSLKGAAFMSALSAKKAGFWERYTILYQVFCAHAHKISQNRPNRNIADECS